MRPIAVCAMVVVERTHVSRSHRNHPAFPTQWFTVTPCSPRCSGRFGHRHQRNCFRQLDTSVGVPGPHGFSVRIRRRRLRHHPRPSHPAPRFVTLRNAPLSGRDLMTILQVQIAVKHYFRKTENNLRNSDPVIPGPERTGPACGGRPQLGNCRSKAHPRCAIAHRGMTSSVFHKLFSVFRKYHLTAIRARHIMIWSRPERGALRNVTKRGAGCGGRGWCSRRRRLMRTCEVVWS